ncbi:MAG TPA: hypothetical protein VGO11_00545 [Chthoniobacteraceae bacterium]|jgi:hypothetical protein|nr:hypothetical protein [Chthoniobacteraceae bacterium]
MKTSLLLLLALGLPAFAADAPVPAATPAKPKLKIIPGKVIFPTNPGEMRRPWGELISIDPVTRTGKFRNEGDDQVMSFTILPYAELLHHATLGDIQDFLPGERAIFRLHEDDKGEWTWLSYIQDEMNMMNGHKEFYHVTAVDPAKGTITADWPTADGALMREKGLVLETTPETHIWKNAEPAKFSDIKVGDLLRERSHGAGAGKRRIAWDLFIDQASLDAFQAKQKIVHADRIKTQGAPGYVDQTSGTGLSLTMFPEGSDLIKDLKAGGKVKVAPAGVDRSATAKAVAATVTEAKTVGRYLTLALTLDAGGAPFQVAGLARLWRE